MNTTLELIKNNDTYKQVLADSFGGIMYDIANRDKYDTSKILGLWNSLSVAEQESAGGIMRGAMNFISGN